MRKLARLRRLRKAPAAVLRTDVAVRSPQGMRAGPVEEEGIRDDTDNTAARQARYPAPRTAGAHGPHCQAASLPPPSAAPAVRASSSAATVTPEWLAHEFEAAGKNQVGVGFITWSLAKRPALLDMALERRPAAVMLSFGDPAPFVDRIKGTGATLICQVQTVAMACDAVAKGADVLVVQGTEAGGHGVARGTITLVPAVVDAVGPDLRIAAAGGIADGRGLAAALMLGASGILMGTRFFASEEAIGHPAAKERILRASGDDTVRSSVFDISRRLAWPAPFTGRALRMPTPITGSDARPTCCSKSRWRRHDTRRPARLATSTSPWCTPVRL